MSRRKALFLDRDGVINVDHGYVCTPERVEFIEGIFKLCRQAKALGYLLIVITNQAGIGRGFYTEADFHQLTDWMRGVFEQEGCVIDAVYFCPTHPTQGLGHYRRESPQRKPNPGMILDAMEDFDIDLDRSLLVGDKLSDIEAGRAAGVACNVMLSLTKRHAEGTNVVHSLDEVGALLG